ncbi:Dabb family protein [Actinomadura bangladeshensis]|uniref:Dabb family protein n=1 Tax=Actinomadura bangladeshensis TaxID=453573 RepID=A0A4R4NNJ8_9ACTN|nr:Dabb family protein [Actinomadura bangladeshensis]TDC09423.1 Dabb family protein [Actinomadura bangladeshensis]
MSGFRHVVMIKWAEGTTTGQQDEVAAKLGELPGRIPEIAAYSTGTNAGVDPGGYEFAIVADFADRGGYLAYRDHPDHRAVVEQFIAPIVAERAAIQYEM